MMKDCPFKKNLTAGDGTRCKETGYFCTLQYESICKVKEKYMHQTNADRIRAMSDEELAKLIAGLSEHCLAGIGACDCSNIETHPCYEVCEEIARNWLQSEVEE